MKFQDSFEASDPRALLRAVRSYGRVRALLHSADRRQGEATRTILAFDPAEQITVADKRNFEKVFRSDANSPWEHCYFGYLSYELLKLVEPSVSVSAPRLLSFPPVWLCRFRRLLVIDHVTGKMDYYAEDALCRPRFLTDAAMLRRLRCAPPLRKPPGILEFNACMRAKTFENKVRYLLEEIKKGTIFQANLTRKFSGRFASMPCYEDIYDNLCEASPAPYSAYLETPFGSIFSCSPELFIRADADGMMCTKPIKGSAPRGEAVREDDALLHELKICSKNRAENLMIVDLARNDLARSCIPGTVKTEYICKPERFRNVHHLVSSVVGLRRADMSQWEALMHAFPPGSMTGAPKVQAMRLIRQCEPMSRGIYSGTLGMFCGDGSMECSVVIRTLLAQKDRFECQVGGGIVADSDPKKELLETAVKLRGIALGLRSERLFRRVALA